MHGYNRHRHTAGMSTFSRIKQVPLIAEMVASLA
jgi:hypothetical protein